MEAPDPAGPLPVGNWSPSRLLDWLLCPARGAWSTGVLELPADFHWPERPAAVRGRAVHAYARARLAGGDVDEARIAGADATFGTGLDPEAWIPFAEAWEAAVRPAIGAPQAVEQRLEADVDGLAVTCVIDAVDEAGAIRDLKTGQRAPDAWAAARESLQAVLYPLAWRQRTGEWAPFLLDHLIAHKQGVQAVTIPVPVTDAAVDRVRRQLAWAQAQAEAGLADPGRIIPNPMTRYGCRECPFLALCAERYGFPALPAPAEPVAAEA
ncbi:MAG: PD-(D/E)XK nuclease family protein [Firmicutes bacterium]|nr:PD-(D/E)XK nuclease family protein [Bacillota bacterium]